LYEFLFDSKFAILLAASLVAGLAATLAGRPGVAWRLLAFNFVPVFAAAYFVVVPLADRSPPVGDLSAAFAFEFVVLVLLARLVIDLMDQVRRIDATTARRALAWTLAGQLALAWPLVGTEGFGIFSEGSRIEYLFAGSGGKYLTYGSLLLGAVQAALLACRLSAGARPRLLDYTVLGVAFSLSLLSGSKGAFFLWLLTVFALVDYRRAQLRVRTVVLGLAALLAAFLAMAEVLRGILGFTQAEFVELVLNRFLLSNDARALALELRSIVGPDAVFWEEAFRSLASLFGTRPVHPPLGVHLFDLYFGDSAGSGANASLMALILFTTAPGDAALPALVAAGAVFVLFLGVKQAARMMPSRLLRLVVTTAGALTLPIMSQDFLAFQVVMPLIVVSVGLLYLIHALRLDLAPLLRARRAGEPLAQRRDPGVGT